MRIAVLIPSLNEADTISGVVRAVDEGLCRYFPNHKAIIVNIDGTSNDGTKTVFKHTKTRTEKLPIDNSKNKIQGKGANIFCGLCYAIDNNIDVFSLLDADVQSIDPSWINKLLKPIVNDRIDLVCPIYTRNRYEGNTTNHFSAPLLKICLKVNIAQPIAGDFGLSRNLVKKAIASFSRESDYQYGIDTLISWTAVGLGMSVCQTKLGRKIHKPSFPKIVPMFHQVCETTFSQITRFKNEILNSHRQILPGKKLTSSIDVSFVRKLEDEKINDLEKLAWKMQSNLADRKFGQLSVFLNHRSIGTELWSDFLSQLIGVILDKTTNTARLGELADLTTSMYLLRVVNYMRTIRNLDASAVTELLREQSDRLNKKLSRVIAGIPQTGK
jgi:glycosyltransferase involved in cell wall biosynthesis